MYLTYTIGGILISIISYFLKDTMNSLKELKKDVRGIEIDISNNKSELALLRQEHDSKIENMTNKLIELSVNVKDLTKEVRALTIEIAKKKVD